MAGGALFFEGVHVFTPHADVPDDSMLRLIFLSPEQNYSREEPRPAFDAVLEYVKNNGTKPRYRSNRLVCLAPDFGSLTRLRDCVRVALAWKSIVEDVQEGRLNIDQLQKKQAEKELQVAEDVLPRAARECYKWLLCPVQHSATDPKQSVEVFPLNTGGTSFGKEVEHVCIENELVISIWSPIHLRAKLRELYWKTDKPTFGAKAFWEDTMRYLYLPRLQNRDVLEQAILKGAASKDFFGTAYGQHEGIYDGFKFGNSLIQVDDTLLLIEPNTAKQYEAAHAATPVPSSGIPPAGVGKPDGAVQEPLPGSGSGSGGAPKAHTFIGSVSVNAPGAKIRMIQIVEEVINVLTSDAQANVNVCVEITAEFPNGVSDQIKRAVSENTLSLGFKNKTWE